MELQKTEYQDLLSELISLVEDTKHDVVSYANSSLTILFWQVGNRILGHTLEYKRADYGKEIIVTLSRTLVEKFGKNYEEKNLRRMIQFAGEFPVFEKVVTLSRQLSWSHFLVLLPVKETNVRNFYGLKAAESAWSVRELRSQIEKKAFERTENANIQIYNSSVLTKDVFKDPYLLDFLEIKDSYLEDDLEAAILKELELFILELGSGFTFVERQKRIIIDGDDYYLDLLFYHRKLKRLVAIELKIDKFKAKYKGQMELYLKWLAKYEKQEGEEMPIGLILCAETSKEQVELLEMHKDGIMVAEYWTDLPPKEVLESKLHKSLVEARERLERKKLRE
ncbi:MAG: PDDEXK nuclease domain-containing protein [Bacteroidota bacterium]|nr:PDDEXK nuclease domain-containing protein [Bacteroidota bacterium]MDP4227804.1 PDDEXK nuclease domain-containing protein [Bacteroidota bacterium]MDP4274257.1 PDDEXK nuclease domain-containing protein [Bacteroidota bacterium]